MVTCSICYYRLVRSFAGHLVLFTALLAGLCSCETIGEIGQGSDASNTSDVSADGVPESGAPDTGSVDTPAPPPADALVTPDAKPADVALVPDAGDLCKGVSCSGHGACLVSAAGAATCDCETYYRAEGLQCVPACTGVTCPTGKACIPGHHNTTDPLCVETCDCGNCGNCGPAQIPSFGQSYCGSASGAPATLACVKPCPAGQGCIPFATPICWSGQGCMSK